MVRKSVGDILIYIVTGDSPRCGSAMVMRSLQAGGMSIAYDSACDKLPYRQARNGYNPNRDGFFELSIDETLRDGFPDPQVYDGKVIKVFPPSWGPLTHLRTGDYKVLWVERSAKARWRSFAKLFEQQPTAKKILGEQSRTTTLRDMASDAALTFVSLRNDMDVSLLSYDEIVEQPLASFETLENRGWPIVSGDSAKIPNAGLRRF